MTLNIGQQSEMSDLTTKRAMNVTLAESKPTMREDAVNYGHDDAALARLGKRPVLKRTFGFLPSLGFSCTLLITWEGVNNLLVTGNTNGGYAGIVYGYIFIWVGQLSVFAALSELTSMAPISSGQYHWVAMLAPSSGRRYLSYITGWFTVTGWLANAATGTYLSGTLIQGLVTLTNPSYSPKSWQGTLLCWAVVAFSVFINTVVSSALPRFEGFILILHIVGFFAVLVPLVVLAPHGTSAELFTVFNNGGLWPTQGLSFFVGLLGNVFAFFGADGAIHMSEEIHNAVTVVPQSMMTALLLNGTLGFAMIIALLFCLGDLNAALQSPTGYPFMEIFLQAARSVPGAATMAAIIVTMSICSTVAIVASSSRITWAFARDKGLPGWSILSKINARTSIPIPAVVLTMVVACLLALINIGSSAAFNDIVGLTISGIYSSYILAVALLLWRRQRGDIKMGGYARNYKDLVWGPWRIPGKLGVANNIFALAYLVIVWFFAFWPSATPVVASTMNYNVLMLGATFILSTIYYLVWARKIYNGPIVEVD